MKLPAKSADPPDSRAPSRRRRKSGLNLIELLGVIAIISILAAMYVGAIGQAFLHVIKTLGH
ncbi:MAG: type II secretion system protein [Limisphaerales bacterium]